MCHFLQEVAERMERGQRPQCVCVDNDKVSLVFADGTVIDLSGEVEWGSEADLAKRACLAKLAVCCGWATSPKLAFDAMKFFPPGYKGELWPPPPNTRV